jgi:hypothetical protein
METRFAQLAREFEDPRGARGHFAHGRAIWTTPESGIFATNAERIASAAADYQELRNRGGAVAPKEMANPRAKKQHMVVDAGTTENDRKGGNALLGNSYSPIPFIGPAPGK